MNVTQSNEDWLWGDFELPSADSNFAPKLEEPKTLREQASELWDSAASVIEACKNSLAEKELRLDELYVKIETLTEGNQALATKVDDLERALAEKTGNEEGADNLKQNVNELAAKLDRTHTRTEEAVTNILEVEKYYHQLSEVIARMGRLCPQLNLEEFESPDFPGPREEGVEEFSKGFDSS